MGKDGSFHDYVVNDLLVDMLGVSSKAIFGEHGIYKNEKSLQLLRKENFCCPLTLDIV